MSSSNIRQAQLFSAYLLDKGVLETPITMALAKRYANVVELHEGPVSDSDKQLLRYLERHPRSLPLADGYLALFQPQSEVRRRLFLMFAMLEATPEHHAYFLPQQRSLLFLFTIAGRGIRGVYRAIAGYAVVRQATRGAAKI